MDAGSVGRNPLGVVINDSDEPERIDDDQPSNLNDQPVGQPIADEPPPVINQPIDTSGQLVDEDDESKKSSCSNTGNSKVLGSPPTTMSAEILDTCPICFEPFTCMGEHRISSLKCGHLFGAVCINRWLTLCGRNDSRCPQCNDKAKKADIRLLYAASVKATDTSAHDQTCKELEKERAARRRLELEATLSKLRYQQALTELGRLQEIVDRHTQSGSKRPNVLGATMSHQQDVPVRLKLDRSITICKEGSCRVMVSLDYFAMIVVSQPNANPLFPGCGLKKLTSLDYRSCESIIALHTKPIRDIAHNASRMDGLLLTASLDKTLKLVSMLSNTVIESFSTDYGVWSCAWNLDNPYQFFAGLANGSVLLYDTRKPSEKITELRCSDSRSPVIALQYVHANSNARFSCGGILTCQLDGCYFCEARPSNEYQIHSLSTEKGPWTSMSYEPDSCHMMMSCRPNTNHQTTRHLVCELSHSMDQEGGSSCQSNIVQTFYGGTSHKTLTRSLLLHCPVDPNITVGCTSDEGSSSLIMWDVKSGSLLQRLPLPETVLDICSIVVNGESYLGALTDKSLNVCSWNSLSFQASWLH